MRRVCEHQKMGSSLGYSAEWLRADELRGAQHVGSDRQLCHGARRAEAGRLGERRVTQRVDWQLRLREAGQLLEPRLACDGRQRRPAGRLT